MDKELQCDNESQSKDVPQSSSVLQSNNVSHNDKGHIKNDGDHVPICSVVPKSHIAAQNHIALQIHSAVSNIVTELQKYETTLNLEPTTSDIQIEHVTRTDFEQCTNEDSNMRCSFRNNYSSAFYGYKKDAFFINAQETMAVTDSTETNLPPPTYNSLRELIIQDEPPKYEAVTGKKLNSDLKFNDKDNEISSTPTPTSAVRRGSPIISKEQKCICCALTFGILIVLLAFAAAAFRLT